MKKIYQNPEMKIVKVQVAQLMVTSPATTTVEVGDNLTTAEGAESRSFNTSIWDDEE